MQSGHGCSSGGLRGDSLVYEIGMERANHQRLIERLRLNDRMRSERAGASEPVGTSEQGVPARPAFRVAAERYRSAAHCERFLR